MLKIGDFVYYKGTLATIYDIKIDTQIGFKVDRSPKYFLEIHDIRENELTQITIPEHEYNIKKNKRVSNRKKK